MREKNTCFRMALLFFALLFVYSAAAQTRNTENNSNTSLPGKHRGAVTVLIRDDEGRLLSAGKDGFLGIWNSNAAEERFQLCLNEITLMAARPGKPQISIVESDGLGLYRLSAWDYEKKRNLFTLEFRDSISYINYSAAGNFLIVMRSGRTGAAFIHAETGEVLESPEGITGSVSFAATSRSERVMICYFLSGILSYWDLETGAELQHFDVPPGIQNPILFGNYCFLGGFDSQGLVIIDAVTGVLLARDLNQRQGIIFADHPDVPDSRGAAQFYSIPTAGGGRTANRMEVNLSGRLTTLSRRNVPAGLDAGVAVSIGSGNIILGSNQGALWFMGSSASSYRELRTASPIRISDIAASSSMLAFIAENGRMGYVPLNYSLLAQNSVLQLESTSDPSRPGVSSSYTNLIADPSDPFASRFLLWQSGTNRSIPVLKTITGPPNEAHSTQVFLEKLSPRFPIRSIAMLGNSILFLDTAGSVSIMDMLSYDVGFTFSAVGSVDAAFIDQETIILGRSAVAGNSPFIAINSLTGETVPLNYPGIAGVRVYRAAGGTLYGAVVNQSGGNIHTSILLLNISNPAQSERLIEYNGEDSAFTIAESGGNLASTLGSGGATLYLKRPAASVSSRPEIIDMERSVGLPVKIIDGKDWLLALDGEGGIAWHDNKTGKIMATLRLYQNLWVLESQGVTIRGRTENKRS